MTLTRKVGALLLLLTAGSLVGTAAFALFFSHTTSDGLFLIAGNLRQTRLQQLYIYALMVRQGEDAVRSSMVSLIEETDLLVGAMDQGGTAVRAGQGMSPVAIANRTKEILVETGPSEAEADRQVIALLGANLPIPTDELKQNGASVREGWT